MKDIHILELSLLYSNFLLHLHIQLMNNPQFSNADETLHTWPMAFVNVEREGQRMDRIPRRNDMLHPGD